MKKLITLLATGVASLGLIGSVNAVDTPATDNNNDEEMHEVVYSDTDEFIINWIINNVKEDGMATFDKTLIDDCFILIENEKAHVGAYYIYLVDFMDKQNKHYTIELDVLACENEIILVYDRISKWNN